VSKQDTIDEVKELKLEVEKLKKQKQILLDAIAPFAKSGWEDLKQAVKKVQDD
jgi:hypothetical protein